MIKLFCVDPSTNLKECLQRGRSSILFSATFLPIQYYKGLLGGEETDYEVYQINIIRGVEYEIKAQGTVIKFLESGTAEIEYFRYPTRITDKNRAKYTFELSPDVLEIMPYGVAGDLLKSDISTSYGAVYSQRYEAMIQRLDPRYSMTSISFEGGIDV